MKKRILSIALFLFAYVAGMNAQQGWTAPIIGVDISTIDISTELYMYNVKADAFASSGMSWGTHAIVKELQNGDNVLSSGVHNCKITRPESERVQISLNGRNYLGGGGPTSTNDCWVDHAQNNVYIYNNVGNNTYTLKPTTATTDSYLDCSWAYGGHITFSATNGYGNTEWAFIKREDITNGNYLLYKAKKELYDIYNGIVAAGHNDTYEEELAAAYEAYSSSGATAATVKAATKTLLAKASAALTEGFYATNSLFVDPDMRGAGDDVNWGNGLNAFGDGIFESWHSAETITQTQTGLPNGFYTVVFHGMYRQDGSDAAPTLKLTSGSNTAVASLKAISEIDFGGCNGNNKWTNANKPDDKYTAGEALAHTDGAVKVEKFLVENGELTITVAMPSASQWLLCHGFEIYFMAESLKEYSNLFETSKQAAEAIDQNGLNAYAKNMLNTALANAKNEELTKEWYLARKKELDDAVSFVEGLRLYLNNVYTLIDKCNEAYTKSTADDKTAFKGAIDKATEDIETASTVDVVKNIFFTLEIARQSFVNPQGWTGATVGDGDFYLYNIGSGKYFSAGNSWGTRSSLNDNAILCTLAASGDNYTISTVSGYANCYLGNNGFVDNGTAWPLKFTNVGNNVYTISSGSNYFGYNDGTSEMAIDITDEMTVNALWVLLTKESIIADMKTKATLDHGLAIPFIMNSGFSRNHTLIWNYTGKTPEVGGDNDNYAMEVYNGASDVYQELTGLPNGVYELLCQGFYRMGSIANAASNHSAGTEELNAKLYINNAESSLMSIMEEAGMMEIGTESDLGYVPNSKSDMSKWFNMGYYDNNKVRVNVTDGKLRIGVKKSVTVSTDWTGFDNFRLIYYGIDLTELKESYASKKAEAESINQEDLNTYVKGQLTEAISSANNVEETEEGLTAAINKLETAIALANRMSEPLAKSYALIEKSKSHHDNSKAGNKTEFKTAIDKAESEIEYATTADAVNAIYDVLEKARQTYVLGGAMPTEGYPFDVTFLVKNPTFDDNSVEGWANTTGVTNKIANNQGAAITGSYLENWNNNSYTGDIQQTVTDLPMGIYKVTMAAFRDQLITNATDKDVVYVFAGDKETLVSATVPAYYSVEEIKVDGGELTIGLRSKEKVYKWMGLDNVTLEMTAGIDLSGLENSLDTKESEAEGISRDGLNNYVKEQLDVAISGAADAERTEAGLTAAINNLVSAIDLAKNMRQPLAKVYDLLDVCNSYYTNSEADDKTAFKAAIDEATTNIESAETVDAVNAVYNALEDARQAYAKSGALPNDGYPFDVTFLVTDAAVTDAAKWTNGNTNQGQQYTNAPDNKYLDIYNGGNVVMTRDMYQTISNLTMGFYTVKAATRASSGITTGYIYAAGSERLTADIHKLGGSGNDLGNGWGWTTVEKVKVLDGNLAIGLYVEMNNGVWAGADDFRLLYHGISGLDRNELVGDEIKSINEQLEIFVNNYNNKKMQTAVWNNLVDKVKAAELAKDSQTATKAEVQTALNELEKAMEPVPASIKVYARLNSIINSISKVNETLNDEGLVSALTTATTAYNKAETDVEGTNGVTSALSTAYVNTMKTFGDGEPVDVTAVLANPNFEEGQTAVPTTSFNIYEPTAWTVNFVVNDDYSNFSHIKAIKYGTEYDGETPVAPSGDNGENLLYIRNNWNEVTTMQATQSIVLPEGRYRVTMDIQHKSGNPPTDLNYIKVGDNEIPLLYDASVDALKTITREIDVAAGEDVELSFGFGNSNGNNFIKLFVDNIRVELLGLEYMAEYYKWLNKAKELYNAIDRATFDDIASSLNGAINTDVSAGTKEVYNAAVVALKDACEWGEVAQKINTTTGNATALIENANAEEGMGWNVENIDLKNNEGYYGAEHYFDANGDEFWAKDNPTASMKQDLKLPKGYYTLSMKARASVNCNWTVSLGDNISVVLPTDGNVGGNIWKFSTPGSEDEVVNGGKGFGWDKMSTCFQLTENSVLKLAVNASASQKNQWFSIDEFELYYSRNGENFVKASDIDVTKLSVDLSETKGILGTPDFSNLKPNAVVYAPLGFVHMIGKTDNVVVDGIANKLMLADKKGFNNAKAFTAKTAEYTRSAYRDGYFETIVLPFATTLPDADNYELCDVKEETNDVVKMKLVEGDGLEAGKAYMMRYKSDPQIDNEDLIFTGTNVAVAAFAEPTGEGLLGSTDTYVVNEQNTIYMFSATSLTFKLAKLGSKSAPFRAFYRTTNGISETKLRVVFEETGISEVLNGMSGKVNVYGINGNMIMKDVEIENATKGLAPGIYIINRHKVIVK